MDPPAAGFTLPLASGAALVLVLGGLSLQTAALQGQAGLVAARRSRGLEDRLASGASQLLARLVLDHPCLLTLPLADWPSAGAACADASQQEALQQQTLADGESPAATAQLQRWEPSAEPLGMDLALELREEGRTARRPVGRFRVWLEPPGVAQGWRVARLQELGLQGGRP
ncbi:MAG: hypothetical protein VKJ66_03580 [Synechococcus sp.]|nr:hypothetical protein [Synechococcus sp.]